MRAYTMNRFAEIEQDSDGTWAVINLVTGLEERRGLSFPRAKTSAFEIGQKYAAIEKEAGW